MNMGTVPAKDGFKSVQDILSWASQEIDVLADEEGGHFLDREYVKTQLRNAWACLRNQAPHRACSFCQGNGCRACDNLGWLSKERHDAGVPKELKE